jgi:hypothetical protein
LPGKAPATAGFVAVQHRFQRPRSWQTGPIWPRFPILIIVADVKQAATGKAGSSPSPPNCSQRPRLLVERAIRAHRGSVDGTSPSCGWIVRPHRPFRPKRPLAAFGQIIGGKAAHDARADDNGIGLKAIRMWIR